MSETTSNTYFLSIKLLCISEFYRAIIATVIFSIKMLHERLLVFFMNILIRYEQVDIISNYVSKCFVILNRERCLSAIYLKKILIADICIERYLQKYYNFCTTKFLFFFKLIHKFNNRLLSILKPSLHSYNSIRILKTKWFGNHIVRHVELKCSFCLNHFRPNILTTKSGNQIISI